MISTSVIHINTSFLPVYFSGAAIVLHSTGRIRHKELLKNISYRLFMLTSLVTTLTCAFGGASMRAAESSQGVHAGIIKVHAWTSALTLLLTLLLAFLSYRAVRGRGERNKTDKILFVFALIFLIFFICTTIIAFKIR
jgi:cytochrome bd-type quinol oxidase subunit 2